MMKPEQDYNEKWDLASIHQQHSKYIATSHCSLLSLRSRAANKTHLKSASQVSPPRLL
jgi:hypothetical protein